MDQAFGIPSHGEPSHHPQRAPARFLVVIDGDGVSLAKLFLENREKVGEFPGGSEEVVNMTGGLSPSGGAGHADWNQALANHTDAERAAAQVYTLDL